MNNSQEKTAQLQNIINAIPGGVAIYKVSDIFETVYYSDGRTGPFRLYSGRICRTCQTGRCQYDLPGRYSNGRQQNTHRSC